MWFGKYEIGRRKSQLSEIIATDREDSGGQQGIQKVKVMIRCFKWSDPVLLLVDWIMTAIMQYVLLLGGGI